MIVGQERSRGRFTYYHDQTINLRSSGIASADSLPLSTHGKVFIKFPDIKVVFTTDAGDITAIEQENLFIAFISSNTCPD